MCVFFSCIVTRQGEVRFCEDDSHETIIRRLGLDDTRPLETRGWVRAERALLTNRAWRGVRVDETSVPGWWDAEMVERVIAVSERVAPAQQAYDAAWAPAQQAYDAACAPARQAYYDAACAQARQAYDAACAQARQAYTATISTIEGYVQGVEP